LKKFLLVLLIFSFVSVANAQELKFMLGGSFSKYEIKPEGYFVSAEGDYLNNETSYKNGFLVGIGVEFALSRRMAVEVDALYFQKGSRIHHVYSLLEKYISPEDFTLRISSIPALIKFKFFSSSSLYVLAGGELSIILSHKKPPDAWVAIAGIDPSGTIEISNTNKKFDHGLVFGAGYELKTEVISFFIEARYHLGLGNIVKKPIYWDSAKTRSIAFILGFKL
jgi:hypothetical protein